MINLKKPFSVLIAKLVPLLFITLISFSLLLTGCGDGADSGGANPPGDGGKLYATASPDIIIDLSTTDGTTIVDKAFNYVNDNASDGPFTLLVDANIAVTGYRQEDYNVTTDNRHLKTIDANLTIIGLDKMRTISLSSSGFLFCADASDSTRHSVELTIGNNITLKGRDGNHLPLVYVHDAIFTLEDNAILTGNKSSSSTILGGGICTHMQAIINMEGGTISNNSALFGGGVYIHPLATFIMNGGKISGNEARGSGGYGGGVYVNGKFTMSGGTIYGREAGSDANTALGGVALHVAGGGMAEYGNGDTLTSTNDTITGKK